jgi:hypothetical protein
MAIPSGHAEGARTVAAAAVVGAQRLRVPLEELVIAGGERVVRGADRLILDGRVVPDARCHRREPHVA